LSWRVLIRTTTEVLFPAYTRPLPPPPCPPPHRILHPHLCLSECFTITRPTPARGPWGTHNRPYYTNIPPLSVYCSLWFRAGRGFVIAFPPPMARFQSCYDKATNHHPSSLRPSQYHFISQPVAFGVLCLFPLSDSHYPSPLSLPLPLLSVSRQPTPLPLPLRMYYFLYMWPATCPYRTTSSAPLLSVASTSQYPSPHIIY
jgi:hypothetical protein